MKIKQSLQKPQWLENLSPSVSRTVVAIIAGIALLGAVVIIPVPGPWSIMLVLVSLVVMSWEFQWAKRLRSSALAKIKTK
ncbi:MAG: PGPGW domain-containing protein [Egibacteraceae bacterium]